MNAVLLRYVTATGIVTHSVGVAFSHSHFVGKNARPLVLVGKQSHTRISVISCRSHFAPVSDWALVLTEK